MQDDMVIAMQMFMSKEKKKCNKRRARARAILFLCAGSAGRCIRARCWIMSNLRVELWPMRTHAVRTSENRRRKEDSIAQPHCNVRSVFAYIGIAGWREAHQCTCAVRAELRLISDNFSTEKVVRLADIFDSKYHVQFRSSSSVL